MPRRTPSGEPRTRASARLLGALGALALLCAALAPARAQERSRHAPPRATPRAARAPSGGAAASATDGWALAEILAAIRHVESGGTPYGGRGARGDGGRALGPYQIHRAYWTDSRVAGRYEDCAEPAYARRVVLAYWRRWCPDALDARDAEVLARVHNGGPDGAREQATLAYWDKVRRRLAGARDSAADATPRFGARASPVRAR